MHGGPFCVYSQLVPHFFQEVGGAYVKADFSDGCQLQLRKWDPLQP